tara:strand:- start:242 stop:460 length:219 start_codon:yes stop_codon:yes gene_type:complete
MIKRTVRGTAEYLGGTKFRFTCKAGHSHTKDMGKGSRIKRMSETACKMYAKYWADEVSFTCKKCENKRGTAR